MSSILLSKLLQKITIALLYFAQVVVCKRIANAGHMWCYSHVAWAVVCVEELMR